MRTGIMLYYVIGGLLITGAQALTAKERVLGNFDRTANKCISGNPNSIVTHDSVTLEDCAYLCGSSSACKSFQIKNQAFNSPNNQYACSLYSETISNSGSNCDNDNYEVKVAGACQWESLGEPYCCTSNQEMLTFRILGTFNNVGNGKCQGVSDPVQVCSQAKDGFGSSANTSGAPGDPCGETMCREFCRQDSNCVAVQFNLNENANEFGECLLFSGTPSSSDGNSNYRCMTLDRSDDALRNECLSRAGSDGRCGNSIHFMGSMDKSQNLGGAEQCACNRAPSYQSDNMIVLSPDIPSGAFEEVKSNGNGGICREHFADGRISAQGIFYEERGVPSLVACQKLCISRLGTSCTGVEYRDDDDDLCELHYGGINTVLPNDRKCFKLTATEAQLRSACFQAAENNSDCSGTPIFTADGFNGMGAGTCLCAKKPPTGNKIASVIHLAGQFTKLGGSQTACRKSNGENGNEYVNPVCHQPGTRVAQPCTLEQCFQKCREYSRDGKFNVCTGVELSYEDNCEVHYGEVETVEEKDHPSDCYKWNSGAVNSNLCGSIGSQADCLQDPGFSADINGCECQASIAPAALQCDIVPTAEAGRRLTSRLRRRLQQAEEYIPEMTETITDPDCGGANGYGFGLMFPSASGDEPLRRLSARRITKDRKEQVFDLNCGLGATDPPSPVTNPVPTPNPVPNPNPVTSTPAPATTPPPNAPTEPTVPPTRLPTVVPGEGNVPTPGPVGNNDGGDNTLIAIIVGSVAGALVVGGGGYTYYKRKNKLGTTVEYAGVNSLPKGASSNFSMLDSKYDNGQYIGSYLGRAEFNNPSFVYAREVQE